MTTKLEQLLEWMDSAEYAPTYGELHEKVKDLISEERSELDCDCIYDYDNTPHCSNCSAPWVAS